MKTGERLVKHAHYYWPLLAESHLTWRLFGGMVRRVTALPLPAGQKLATGRRTTEIKKEKERFRNRFKVLRFPVFRCPGWDSLSMIIAWPREEQRIVTAAIDQALRDLYAAHVLDAKWKS